MVVVVVVVVVVVGLKDPKNSGGTASPTRVRACLKYECAAEGDTVPKSVARTGGDGGGLAFVVRRGLEGGTMNGTLW